MLEHYKMWQAWVPILIIAVWIVYLRNLSTTIEAFAWRQEVFG